MQQSRRPQCLRRQVDSLAWVSQADVSSTPRRGVAGDVCEYMRVCHFDNMVVVVLKGVC